LIYMTAVAAVLCFCAVFASGFALYFGMQAWAKVQALEKATHTIQYVPLDDGKDLNKQVDDIDEKLYEGLGRSGDLEEIEDLA